jgi:hypothetical protein
MASLIKGEVVVVPLQETIWLMEQIDAAIPSW